MKTEQIEQTQQFTPGPYPLTILANQHHYTVITNQGNHFACTYDPLAARLIASAPELLATCKRTEMHLSQLLARGDFEEGKDTKLTRQWLEQVRAAILKATTPGDTKE